MTRLSVGQTNPYGKQDGTPLKIYFRLSDVFVSGEFTFQAFQYFSIARAMLVTPRRGHRGGMQRMHPPHQT